MRWPGVRARLCGAAGDGDGRKAASARLFYSRFVGNALQTVRAGAAGPASSRLRLVCTYARVRGVGRDGCVFAKNPAVLQKLLLPKIANYHMNSLRRLVTCHI